MGRPKKKKVVKLYTLYALAEKLEISYQYLRQHVLDRYKRGEIDNFKGFKFFGEPNKTWYAYEASDVDIEIVKARSEEEPEKK